MGMWSLLCLFHRAAPDPLRERMGMEGLCVWHCGVYHYVGPEGRAVGRCFVVFMTIRSQDISSITKFSRITWRLKHRLLSPNPRVSNSVFGGGLIIWISHPSRPGDAENAAPST